MAATLTTLFSFGVESYPTGSLIADANGDLFGTTQAAGANGDGTVFELVKSGSGYTLSTLVSFNGANGSNPYGSLIADANGDLFGTTDSGGANDEGTVFELVKSGSGYTFSTLVSFFVPNGNPQGSLIADANGDLFGTTLGSGTDGTVFELVKSGSGYTLSNPPLASFPVYNAFNPPTGPQYPYGSLIADANGDLFGTSGLGGVNGEGTVFEVKNDSDHTVSTLASFNGANGSSPYGSLIADANGDLFGTTASGGANDEGTVFELVKGGSAVSTLVSFNGANGNHPYGSLIADANGDLFGTTYSGGANGDGTVFELVKSDSGYTVSTLVSFNGANGSNPYGSLIADANGDLFGTTQGTTQFPGTVFEIQFATGALFTTGNDIVNFNENAPDGLTPAQQAAIAAGADIYNGLGGNDVVTLPNVANYNESAGNGKTLNWDPSKTFTETDTAGQHVTINGGNGVTNIKVGDGNDTINLGASGGNVTIGSGSDTVVSSASVSSANPKINAATVGFSGVDLSSSVTFTHSAPQNPFSGGTYTNANLALGGLRFTYQGANNVYVSAGSQLDTLTNVQFVESGTAGGTSPKLPLDAINIVFTESSSTPGYGTLCVTDDGQPIAGLASNVKCAFDQLMPVPDGTYDVIYRLNSSAGGLALELSDYNAQSWFGPTRTGIQLHIGNNPGDSDGCIVVGKFGNGPGGTATNFWNTLTAFLNSIMPPTNDATQLKGETFYRIPIPMTLTVQNDPGQPILHIEKPVVQGNSAIVDFKIDGAAVGAAPLRDKDITFYFTITGAKSSAYSVSNASPIAPGSNIYEATIVGSHQDSKAAGYTAGGANDIKVTINYNDSSAANLTVQLVSPNGTNQYYDGETYPTLKQPSSYDPPSQPLINATSLLPQTISFNSSVGTLIDGYISGATVFADANGTGQLAANDASTTTDTNGNFTLTGGTGPLYAFGGTDTSTGLPFKGHLEAPAGSTVIDPLTTLVSGLQANAGLSLTAAQQEVLTALGLSSSINLTTLDPIAGVKSGDATSAAAYVAGTKVIDTVEMIATTMTGAGVSFSKAFADAFAVLDAKINALPAGQTLNLSDQTTVSALINSVAQTESVHLPFAANEAAAIAASNALLDQTLAKDGASPTLLTDVATTQLAALTTPIAVPDFAHATFGTTIHVAAAGVLANDTPGVTGDTFTVSAVDGLSQNVGTTVAGAYGTLTLDADGSYAYKTYGHSVLPLTGVSEDFFGYTAHEGGPSGGGSASSTLTVVVTFPGLAYVAAPVGGSATQANGLHYAVLDGSAGGATLHAVNGIGAALVGGNGDTLNLANIGVDTVVAMGNFGQITVNNYKANGLLVFDVIQLSKSDFGTKPAAIANDATQAPGSHNTVITDPVNHDTITLAGVSLSSLHFDASHFLLV